MRHHGTKALNLVGGMGVGAGLMYLLDPDRGRRRRAWLRDKAVTLAQRVRSRLGRLVSHPASIHVDVDHGIVRLGGLILESEVDDLLSGVFSIKGVKTIDNHLSIHRESGDVPGLQGGVRRRRGPLFEIFQENWSPRHPHACRRNRCSARSLRLRPSRHDRHSRWRCRIRTACPRRDQS